MVKSNPRSIRPADLARALAAIDRRIDTARARLAEQSRTTVLFGADGMTRAGFEALPLERRRAIVAALFTVTVLPSTRRGQGFDPRYVKITPVE